MFGLPKQIHSHNSRKFIQLWKELIQELKILLTKTPPYHSSSNILERWHRTIVGILRAMGREMQDEWDLAVKATCLAYNTTLQTSTGQTLFFAMFGWKVTLPVNWIYPLPEADREMELSDWTEVMQERFQRAYAGMREKQQATVCRNAQLYKSIVSRFKVGEWVWVFIQRLYIEVVG